MPNSARRLALLSIFLALPALACQAINTVAAPETAIPALDLIAGQYEVSGTNPDGTAYTGSLNIQRTELGYQLTWRIGDQLFTGTGTLAGDLLTVTWRGAGGEGQSVYTRETDGRLTGTWTVAGQAEAGQETLTPVE